MLFDTIYIQNFRNIEALRFEPSPGLNVIEGQNGQGKTSLLEALHLSVTLRSFRGHPTRDLIRIGSDRSVIATRILREGVPRDVELQLAGSRRTIRVNGDRVRNLDEYFSEAMRMVTFTPDDVGIFKGGPQERRLFFDRMIFNLIPEFGAESMRYEQALKQRNALLRQEPLDQRTLEVYEQVLADYGAKIIARRTSFIDVFSEPLSAAFSEVYGQEYEAQVFYEAGAENREDLYQKILRQRPTDLLRGHTTVGPHRDDFGATLQGVTFRNFASQGQHRSFVLACKITEMRQNFEQYGAWPVLLMDDVSSELDPQRNAQLFQFLETLNSQVFLTTTNQSMLQLPESRRLWAMEQGQLQSFG